MIRKYGAKAILRRSEGDRECIVCEDMYSPRPQPGQLRNTPERSYLIDAEGLDPAPDSEKDHLVLLDPASGLEAENLRLLAPIDRLAPGQVVLYYAVQVAKR